jgi:F-type H+-transporting ATPase subunit delta
MRINKQARRDAKQLFQLCMVGGLPDENRVRQVALSIASAGYRNVPAVLAHFLRLVRLDALEHSANVESAMPLPEDLRSEIRSNLERRYGAGLTTTFAYRPELIGGVRIQVGSHVYDGSVLGELTALEKKF